MDEIHTYNDSRDDFRNQLKFYKNSPTFLHPPLFFILTHQFYPFTKPERDLRIIPLIFGTLSILTIYFLAKQFSPHIAIPCTVSLAFMAYHISLSQDGRSYAFLMFIGMASIYFFMRHLNTLRKRYLIVVGVLFAFLFHTSYSSIPFIVLSQLLWFYQTNQNDQRPRFTSFLILNGITLLLCLPWVLFIALNYKGQSINNPFHTEDPGSPFSFSRSEDFISIANYSMSNTLSRQGISSIFYPSSLLLYTYRSKPSNLDQTGLRDLCVLDYFLYSFLSHPIL